MFKRSKFKFGSGVLMLLTVCGLQPVFAVEVRPSIELKQLERVSGSPALQAESRAFHARSKVPVALPFEQFLKPPPEPPEWHKRPIPGVALPEPAKPRIVIHTTADGYDLAASVKAGIESRPGTSGAGTTSRGAAVGIQAAGSSSGFDGLCGGSPVIVIADRPISARDRAMCSRGQVSVLEVPAISEPFVFAVSSRNNWLTELDVDQVKRLLNPARDGFMQWSDLGAKYPKSPVKLYMPPPTDSSSTTLQGVLAMSAFTAGGTYLGEPALLAKAIAQDQNSMGWIPGHLAGRPGLRTVEVKDGQGRSLGRSLAKPFLVYVNASLANDAEYSNAALEAIRTIPVASSAVGGSILNEGLRVAALQRLVRGQGGFVTSENASASDLLAGRFGGFTD